MDVRNTDDASSPGWGPPRIRASGAGVVQPLRRSEKGPTARPGGDNPFAQGRMATKPLASSMTQVVGVACE